MLDATPLNLGGYLLENINALWTFMLLAVRFGILFTMLPGLSLTPTARMLRMPAVLLLSTVTCLNSPQAIVPESFGIMMVQVFSEAVFGLALGLIPLMIVAGVQMAGSLSSTTMGLGASQLVDPTLGGSITALARLLGDFVILIFLLSNTHHTVIYAAAGLGGVIVPGTYTPTFASTEVLLNRVSDAFELGALVASPVIVALMLTNFVMGLISKAIPQVNIFIVSFPLTIGIGLILTGLSLPELIVVIERQLTTIDASILGVLRDVSTVPAT
ncbi:MAG: flagellar biosynthetic protein FliR [Bdellovibrionales bacterium]|nr:flagellar biosynthetic protein FliR [Bdellovibrionales bacterium]